MPADLGATPPFTVGRRGLLRGAGSLAVLATLGGGLSGCGGSGAPARIRFYANKRETIPYFTKVANEFNSSQTKYRAAIENSTNLVADFVRNTPVPIGMTTFNLAFGGFIKRGVLADQSTNPKLKTIRPEVIEYSKQFGTYRDELNAVPYSLAPGGVIYNRELFAKVGVSVPTTWSEFNDVCDKLLTKGITPLEGTFLDGWTVQQGMFDFVLGGTLPKVSDFFAELNKQGTDIGANSKVSFSNDFRQPMKQMLELLPFFNKDAKNIAYDQGNRDFAAGKAAMMLQGPWAYAGILGANPKLKLGMFPLPCTDDAKDTKAWVNLDLVLFTPRGIPNPQRDGGLAVLDFLMDPDVMHRYNADNLAFSPDVDAPPQSDPRVSDMNSYIDRGEFYQGAGYFFPGAVPLQQYLQAYLYGGSLDSFLSKLDSDWKRLAVRTSA